MFSVGSVLITPGLSFRCRGLVSVANLLSDTFDRSSLMPKKLVAVIALAAASAAWGLRVGHPLPRARGFEGRSGVGVRRRAAPESSGAPSVAETSLEEETVLAPDDERKARLKRDIERFRAAEAAAPREPETANPLVAVVSVLGAILSVNFVIIVALFLWFLYGCFAYGVLGEDAVILAVKAAFDPYILPILSTHMGLTFLSAGLEQVAGVNDD
mmetsp:Transcript_17195/g.69177  ORF Transcript_17195/g.69177 Transcript_17195/m.69177 type:complete len:214 (-) Transcript_17195:145-786(-)